MTNQRVIAIGFEAMEPELVEKWMAEGHLPHFKKLRDQGTFRKMRSPAEVSSGATWSSINCGVTPGKHGMGFCHRQFKNGSYDVRKKRADEVGRLPFWVDLAKQGKRVCIMDVPETRIYENVEGVQIVGWGLEYQAWDKVSVPAEIMSDIELKYGAHPLHGWYQEKPETTEEWQQIINNVVSATYTRTKIIKDLLQKESWDFFLVAYAETHFAGHLFWHISDPEHPEYDPEIAKILGNPILENYKACDQALKEIMELEPHANIVIISNTGMGPNYSARHFIGPILSRLNLTPEKKTKSIFRKGLEKVLPAADVYAVENFEKLIGPKNITRIKNFIPEKFWDKWSRKFLNAGNNWKDSIAFDIPGDNTGTIRVNLKDREPAGKVDPSDYDSIIDKIEEACMDLINKDTGEKAVREVVRVRKKYEGPNNIDLPDVLIKWTEGKPIYRLYSERFGLIEKDHLPDKRTGAHRDFGFFIGCGKDFLSCSTKNLEQMYNWDVAPTIMHLMELPQSSDYDGNPQLDMINDSFKSETKVEVTS